jgi:lipoteichoic acid synthase
MNASASQICVPRRLMPRAETTALAIGLLWTITAKLAVIIPHQTDSLAAAWVGVALPDIAFFGIAFLVMTLLYAWRPHPLISRAALLAAGLALCWSVANAAWLITTGVQLQPGMVLTLIRNFTEIWPIVFSYIQRNALLALPGLLTLAGVAVWFSWRVARPAPIDPRRSRHLRRGLYALLALAVAGVAGWTGHHRSDLGFRREVLGFSSHFQALLSMAQNVASPPESTQPARVVPLAGQRRVVPPTVSAEALPNIVLVMLESVSWRYTGLADPRLDTTPHLARLAAEGASFELTRVPVADTAKAFWVALTGTGPDVHSDHVEAVLVPDPYEALPTLLARAGYRSAFFQMSKGSFRCTPGLFANLAFDWAWFRENLQDPSADLGYLSGDDLRMLPAVAQWIDQDRGPTSHRPFFLMTITSVAHDPYEVPASFGPPKEDRLEAYLQAVRYTDHFLGQLRHMLQERGLEENTILCVIGDHGEEFQNASHRTRWIPCEDLLRVPWVIRFPERVPAGVRVDWPCSQLDVAPTLLELAGFDTSEAGFEGRDAFVPARPDRRLYFFSPYLDSPSGFVEGPRKFTWWPYNDLVFEHDLDTDPTENHPRMITGPRREQIIADIAAWRSGSHIHVPADADGERRVFGNWQVWFSGRSAWAEYIP